MRCMSRSRAIHGFSAYIVMSSVAARFFPPQSAGAGATSGVARERAIHSASITTKSSTRPRTSSTRSPTMAVGSTASGAASIGATTPAWSPDRCPATTSLTPTASAIQSTAGPPSRSAASPGVDLSGLTADQQFEAGITCNGVAATPTSADLLLPCVTIHLQAGADSRPRARRTTTITRRASRPRNLFDVSLGKNNIFNKEHFKTDLDLTAINVTNKYALYNFLSTFSGTHYVTPRALTAKLTLNF